MQTECVQESRESLHNQEDGDGQQSEEEENHYEHRRSHVALPRQGLMHQHTPQLLWELCRDTKDSLSGWGGTKPHQWMNNSLSMFGLRQEVFFFCVHHVRMRLCICTNVNEPNWEPRVAGTTPCWRYSPGSTRWCGWPGAWTRLRRQTPAGSADPTIK